jgi:hypothetical protein
MMKAFSILVLEEGRKGSKKRRWERQKERVFLGSW